MIDDHSLLPLGARKSGISFHNSRIHVRDVRVDINSEWVDGFVSAPHKHALLKSPSYPAEAPSIRLRLAYHLESISSLSINCSFPFALDSYNVASLRSA